MTLTKNFHTATSTPTAITFDERASGPGTQFECVAEGHQDVA